MARYNPENKSWDFDNELPLFEPALRLHASLYEHDRANNSIVSLQSDGIHVLGDGQISKYDRRIQTAVSARSAGNRQSDKINDSIELFQGDLPYKFSCPTHP